MHLSYLGARAKKNQKFDYRIEKNWGEKIGENKRKEKDIERNVIGYVEERRKKTIFKMRISESWSILEKIASFSRTKFKYFVLKVTL